MAHFSSIDPRRTTYCYILTQLTHSVIWREKFLFHAPTAVVVKAVRFREPFQILILSGLLFEFEFLYTRLNTAMIGQKTDSSCPVGEDECHICAIDDAVAIKIGHLIVATPRCQDEREICTINFTIEVDVAGNPCIETHR